jgi:hypothetical protein
VGKLGPAVRAYLRSLAKKGGRARMSALTPEQRRVLAVMAVTSRWKATTPEERSLTMKAVRAGKKKKRPGAKG